MFQAVVKVEPYRTMPYPDKQPEAGGYAPVAILRALLHEAALISPYLIVLDDTLCTELSRHGLVVVSLGDNLTVYYFHFHT